MVFVQHCLVVYHIPKQIEKQLLVKTMDIKHPKQNKNPVCLTYHFLRKFPHGFTEKIPGFSIVLGGLIIPTSGRLPAEKSSVSIRDPYTL